MASGRTVVPHGPTVNLRLEAADIRGQPGAWMDTVGTVARSLALIIVTAFAILVLLPAAVAAQAGVPI